MFFVSLTLYALFSLMLFYAHALRFNVNSEFQFWFLLSVSAGIAVSYALCAASLANTTISKRIIRWGIPSAGIFFIAVYFFMPHPFYVLNDLRLYFFHAKIFSVYGQNPYFTAPLQFVFDPDFSYIQHWAGQTFNYGPVWLVASMLPLLFTHTMESGIFWYKIISLLAYAGTVLCVYRLYQSDKKILFLALVHPVLLYWGITGGHNDMLMLFFVMACLLALQKEKFFWAILLFVFAVLVKYPAALLFPFVLWHIYKHYGWRKTALSVFAVLFVVFVSYLPFSAGFSAYTGSMSLINPRLSGPAFSAAYFLTAKTLEYDTFVFQKMAMVFFAIMVFGYTGLVLYWLKKSEGLENSNARFFWIFFWLYFVTFWFQPWYILWIVPFTFVFLKHSPRHFFAQCAFTAYSLIFYIVSYTYSSFFGMAVALMIACGAGMCYVSLTVHRKARLKIL